MADAGQERGLVKLPEMKQPVQIKIAEFLINLILAACTDYPDLYSLAIIKLVTMRCDAVTPKWLPLSARL